MAKLTDEQLERKALQDTVRTIVRLKHRIAARNELNDVETEVLAEFDERVSSGLPYRPDLGALVKGEL